MCVFEQKQYSSKSLFVCDWSACYEWVCGWSAFFLSFACLICLPVDKSMVTTHYSCYIQPYKLVMQYSIISSIFNHITSIALVGTHERIPKIRLSKCLLLRFL